MRIVKCVAAAMMLVILFLCIPVSADGLEITTTATLPAGDANVPYTPVQLQVQGGTPPYTFKMLSSRSLLPAGMTFDNATGTFSGTPTSGLFYGGIRIRVTDATGASVEKRFSINISAVMVEYRISGETTAVYDGTEKGIAPENIEAYVDGVKRDDISYYVKYGSLSSNPKDVGSYRVRVVTTQPGYLTGRANVSQYRIERAAAEVSFSNLTHQYTGTPKYATVSVTEGVAYTVTYTTLAGVEVAAPIEPGQYRVTCNFIDTNYAPPAINNAIMTITARPVSFTWLGREVVYDGNPHPVTLTPSEPNVAYQVTYEKDGVSFTEPIEAGQYRIVITITDPHYTFAGVQPETLTIRPPTYPVSVRANYENMAIVTIAGESVREKEFLEGEEVIVTIHPNSGCRLLNWQLLPDTLEYTGDENTITFQMPAEPVTISAMFEGDYYLTLEPGNSIAARLDEAGLQQFLLDRRYLGKVYSTAAWDTVDCDADPTALFVRVGQSIVLPGATGMDSTGQVVQQITMTVENPYGTGQNLSIETGGQFTADNRVKSGVYNITYAFDDPGLQRPVTVKRPLVVVGPMGDANGDGIVNSIDANFIGDAAQSMPEDTPAQKFLKYRLCDINLDGVVDSVDAQAVYNRIKTPLPLCYPFLDD